MGNWVGLLNENPTRTSTSERINFSPNLWCWLLLGPPTSVAILARASLSRHQWQAARSVVSPCCNCPWSSRSRPGVGPNVGRSRSCRIKRKKSGLPLPVLPRQRRSFGCVIGDLARSLPRKMSRRVRPRTPKTRVRSLRRGVLKALLLRTAAGILESNQIFTRHPS